MRWPHLLVIGSVLATYGFELFNFNVSVDEPMFWNFSRLEMFGVWNGQGRWGMALAALLLPSANVPVVSLALGLFATTLSMWWLARRILNLTEWEAAATTALAVTLPALVFHFSFSINSLGLGLGFVACVLCAHLCFNGGLAGKVGAVVAGAFAIGVYEGLAFALAAVLLAHVWERPRWRSVIESIAVMLGAAVVWFVLNIIAVNSSSSSTGYVSEMMGGSEDAGLLGAVRDAVVRMIGIIAERWLYFGYTNPLPAIVLAVSFIAGVEAARKRPRADRVVSVLVLVALIAVVITPGVLTGVVFQRSMVFLPPVFVVALGIGLPTLRRAQPVLQWAGATLAVLAIAGNASLANGAYYSGTIISDADQDVASDTIAAYRSLPRDFEGPLPLVVLTRSDEFTRPATWSGRSSLELGMMGAPGEALRYLQMRGLDVIAPTEDQQARGEAVLADMPAYPLEGYLDVVDGILVVNLATVPGR